MLDNSIGLSVSRLVLKKFELAQKAAESFAEQEADSVSETEVEIIVPSVPLSLAASAGPNVSLEE